MKIRLLTALAACLLLGGCVDEGKGPAAPAANGEEPMPLTSAEKAQLPYEGPAGGEKNDQTAPNMPASASANGSTVSAFPSTVPPGN